MSLENIWHYLRTVLVVTTQREEAVLLASSR